jgi:uncharacterized protein involved in response to NO
LHFIRLLRWQGAQTLSEPLLWILHLGYVFVPLGAVVEGVLILQSNAFRGVAAQHLWMVGAFGVMTLAMMTRATLGHTGQTLHAGQGTLAVYLALIGSVVARFCAAFWVDAAMTFYAVSGILWIGAFIGFAAVYGPCLVRIKPAGG